MESVRKLQHRRAIRDRTSNSDARHPTQLHPQNAPRDRCPVSEHLSPRVLGVDILRAQCAWDGYSLIEVFPHTLDGYNPSGSEMEGVRTLQDGKCVLDSTSNSEAKSPAQLQFPLVTFRRDPVQNHALSIVTFLQLTFTQAHCLCMAWWGYAKRKQFKSISDEKPAESVTPLPGPPV